MSLSPSSWTSWTSPVLASGREMPAKPADLLDYALIHERDRGGWRQWFAAAGVDVADEIPGTIVDDANLVLQTTLNGQGVALGILPFVEDELKGDRLIRPFGLAVDPGKAYYLIYAESRLRNPAVKRVRDWLLEQIETA